MKIVLFLLVIVSIYGHTIHRSFGSKIGKFVRSAVARTSSKFFASFQTENDRQIKDNTIPPLKQEPPLNILLLVEPTPFNYISGYANRFKETLDHLHTAGDKVHVITTDGNPSPPQSYRNYSITTLAGIALPMYKAVRVSLDIKGKILQYLRKHRPDIIHVSSPSFIMLPALLWSRIFKLPLVLSYHTHIVEYAKNYVKVPGAVNFAKWLLRSTHSKADMTLCTSPQLKDDLAALGLDNVDVWQKGINTKVFNPSFRNQDMRMKLSDGDPDAPLLLYVGRLGVEKKLARLRKVLDAIPTARLALVGHGPAEGSLKEFFKGYRVNFVGSLSGEPLSQAFASADIFVMPSDTETLGFVVLEAMASGLPVAAVNAGGLPDIVEDNYNGALVANDDNLEEFTSRVNDWILNKDKRIKLGQQARQWAERWNWESATSELRNKHYRQAIKNFQIKKQAKIVPQPEYCSYYRPDFAI